MFNEPIKPGEIFEFDNGCVVQLLQGFICGPPGLMWQVRFHHLNGVIYELSFGESLGLRERIVRRRTEPTLEEAFKVVRAERMGAKLAQVCDEKLLASIKAVQPERMVVNPVCTCTGPAGNPHEPQCPSALYNEELPFEKTGSESFEEAVKQIYECMHSDAIVEIPARPEGASIDELLNRHPQTVNVSPFAEDVAGHIRCAIE